MQKNLIFVTAFSLIVSISSGCNSAQDSHSMLPTSEVLKTSGPGGFKTGGSECISKASYTSGGAGAVIPSSTAQVQQRQMTFQATIYLTVQDIRTATDVIIDLVKRHKGYLQAQNGKHLSLKIPAAGLDRMIAAIEPLGKITNKVIMAEDVTDQVFDLKTRIDNLEKLRLRLVALLDKAIKVEDALKLEQELARITTELEILKGRQRLLANDIAYSILQVYLNSELPQEKVQQFIPVEWVKELGTEITRNEYPNNPGTYKPINIALPEEFVIIYANPSWNETVAASSEGVTLQLTRKSGLPGAKADFWRKLIRRSLEEANAFHVTADETLTTGGELPSFRIEACKNIGGKSYFYLVAVMVDTDNDRLYLVECWGEKELFSRTRQALLKSLSAIKPWSWWQSAY